MVAVLLDLDPVYLNSTPIGGLELCIRNHSTEIEHLSIHILRFSSDLNTLVCDRSDHI